MAKQPAGPVDLPTGPIRGYIWFDLIGPSAHMKQLTYEEDGLYYQFVASSQAYAHYNRRSYTYAELVAYAQQQGVTHIHFTERDPNPGPQFWSGK